MAFVKDVFAKRSDLPPSGAGKEETPTEDVIALRKQGLTNNQIISSLQRSGHSLNKIYEALNQADLKGGVEGFPLERGEKMEQPNMQEQAAYPYPPQPTQEFMQHQMPPAEGYQPYVQAASGEERVQEIAEAIIDEKWSELIANVNKILEWKDKIESKIGAIEQRITDLKNDFDKLHTSILDRVGEYDKNVSDVGTELKALEKVFQKVLPTLTENVSELSRITQDIKRKK